MDRAHYQTPGARSYKTRGPVRSSPTHVPSTCTLLSASLNRMTLPPPYFFDIVTNPPPSSTLDLYKMTLQRAVQESMHTPSSNTTRPPNKPSSVKASPNKGVSRPKPWQKTAVVAVKDFNIADIRNEFDCNKVGWAGVDIEVHSMLNGHSLTN